MLKLRSPDTANRTTPVAWQLFKRRSSRNIPSTISLTWLVDVAASATFVLSWCLFSKGLLFGLLAHYLQKTIRKQILKSMLKIIAYLNHFTILVRYASLQPRPKR